MNTNRFYFAQENLSEVADTLLSKGYEELPECIVSHSSEIKIIFDTNLKHFWRLDQKCFENNIPVIKNKYNQSITPTDLQTIQSTF